MTTIGERIKKIRKELDLTQAAFASRIGSVQNSVTGYENGRRNPSQPVISLICSEFNVNEEWLKTGEGEMFKPAPSSALDALAKEYDLPEAAYVMIEKFLKLKPSVQEAVYDYMQEVVSALKSDNIDPMTPAFPSSKPMPDIPLSEMTVEQLEEEYKKSRSASASKRNSSVSNITEGNERKEANN